MLHGYPTSCAVQLPKGVDELGPSLLKADLVPGKRLLNFQVVYQADCAVARIQERLRATGAFRIVVFAGDIAKPALLARLQDLGKFLGDRATSPAWLVAHVLSPTTRVFPWSAGRPTWASTDHYTHTSHHVFHISAL